MRKLLPCCRLLAKAGVPYLIHKIPRPKGSGFWLVAMQVIASFNLLLSIVVLSFSFSLSPYSTFDVSRCTFRFTYMLNVVWSIQMALGFLRFRRKHWWSSCYIWAGKFTTAWLYEYLRVICCLLNHSCISLYLIVRMFPVWVEGPLGFGLLLSCRIVQAFQLYNLFVK